jgi:hypothetical protein
MITLKSKLQLGLLSTAILGLAIVMPVRAENKEDKEAPPMETRGCGGAKVVAALDTATKLLEYGLETRRPEAVATAVIMLAQNNQGSSPETQAMIIAGVKDSVSQAWKFKTAGAYSDLLNRAEEATGEFHTKCVKSVHVFAGNISRKGQTVKEECDCPKNKWASVLVKNVLPGSATRFHVIVRSTRDENPIVAESWGNSVHLTWWPIDENPYSISVEYFSGRGPIDFVGYTNLRGR